MAMIVKSFRVDPELWLWVVGRAAQKRITASAWLVRMLEDTRQRLEVMPTDRGPTPMGTTPETRPAHPKTPAPAAQPLGELVGQTPVQSVHFGPQTPKPGSRLKKR